MSADDWYRNKNWDNEVERTFYEKLKRARSQRYQYMVIQALMLSESHPDISLRLVDEYFAARSDQFEDTRALLVRAQAYVSLAELDAAVAAYHALLQREQEFPNVQTGAYLDYPYLVATEQIAAEYEAAITLLDLHFDRLTFPLDHFKWYASHALIRNDGVKATKALDVARVKKSGFRFHQDVGLVGKEHKNTIKKLLKIRT